jgi:asparagine synthase (glutamine-hydrolysing)
VKSELAGIHDTRGADADRLRRAHPGATLAEAGALALAAPRLEHAGEVTAAVVGRVHGSAEPLAAAYARSGANILDGLRGPFALVAWHRAAQRGLLAQDPLGGRSLFLHRSGTRVLFATEVALLLRLLDRTPGPDELALAFHLVDHSVPDGRMLYEGIERLGGGRHLVLGPTRSEPRRHWAPRHEPPLDAPRPELAERLRDELAAAVQRASAEKAALLLSGGLDSSAIAAFVTPRPHAVTATFPAEPDLDESAWAAQVADHLGLPLTKAPVQGRSPLDAAEEYVRRWRLPLPVPGIVIEEPMVAAAAGLGANAVLDGQGGDELFSAAFFLIADHLRHLRPDKAWRLARRNPWIGADPPRRHVWQVFRRTGVRGAAPLFLHEFVRRRRPAERYVPAWLHPRLARQYRDAEDPWRWKRLDGPLWWAFQADVLTRGRERVDIADYVRRRAQAQGLEARSPLLDLGLVEVALKLPPEANFDPITSRPLVREALAESLPPAVLARRDKRDYAGFHHRALQTEASVGRIRALLQDGARVGAYIDLPRFRREILDHPPAVGDPGWRAWGVHVWNVVTAEQWLRSGAS